MTAPDRPDISTAVLGGEVRHRKGMANPTTRVIVMGALVAVGAYFFTTPGLFVGLVAAGVLYVISLSGGGDASITANLTARRRWRRTVRRGFDRFDHVSRRPVNCRRGKEWNSYRDFTDGDDEWEWLSPPDATSPGVMYHDPADRSGLYFSATFAVEGMLVGLVGDDEVDAAQVEFADLLAGWGDRQKLVSTVQVTTRMLPQDTARHRRWMSRQLDEDTPEAQIEDYQVLLGKITSRRYIQRHYVTLRWNKTERFDAAAAAHAKGIEGWRQLIAVQLESARQQLVDAGYRSPQPLTAPQLLAVLRHLQNPSHSIDALADLTATNWYQQSQSQFSSVTTADQWVHATAQFAADAISTQERTGLWLRPLLLGMHERLYRTVSIHITLVAAADATDRAMRDATADEADQIQAQRKGKRQDGSTALALTAAQRRIDDLTAGQGHHGALWAGFVTVTVPVAGNIAAARGAAEEAASECLIGRLQWADSYQAAAQCFTWPIGRAVRGERAPLVARVLQSASIKTGGK